MINQKLSHKPKPDRYDKMNNTKTLLRESSWAGSSYDTTATISQDIIPQTKQCRICLSLEDANGSAQLYSPCKCTGSVKYLHKHCFLQWMNKNFQHKKIQQKARILNEGTQCEICKQKICIKGGFEVSCARLDDICFKIRHKPVLFTVFSLMQVTCLGVLAFVITMMLQLGLKFEGNYLVDSLIMICSLVLVLVMAFVVGYFYIKDYFTHQKFTISDFGKPAISPNPQVASEMNLQAQIEPSIINLEE